MTANILTQKKLKELLYYDAETGDFTNLSDRSSRALAGSKSGFVSDGGYILISINCVKYRAHRLAWLYVYGEFPENQIDHINHDRADNRITNLRAATNEENHKNMTMQKNNKSGIVGVHWDKRANSWCSYIDSKMKRIHICRNKSLFEAVCARKSAEIKYGYHKNHGR